MSSIRIFRQCLRALSPAFFAPHSSGSGTEHLSATAEAAADAHTAGRTGCWIDRDFGFAHPGCKQGSVVEAGESFYAASRQQTIVRALHNGFV